MGRKGGFPGGGMGNMGAMMKQAQKMQVELARAQEEIKDMTFEASAGGGMVKAVAQGDNSLVSLTIDPEAVDPEDVEMLQDMITAAVNEALRGVAELGAQRINAANRRHEHPRPDVGSGSVQSAPAIQKLLDELERLPGVGPKSAQRMAYWILNSDRATALRLAQAIVEVKDTVHFCSRCFNYAEDDLCEICRSTSRNQQLLCVVSEPRDIPPIERTAVFQGVYHVLGGALSPMDGIGPDDLRIPQLMQRLGSEDIREVVLATNPNVEGETTAAYLARLIKPLGIKVTRLASGLPVGGDLEFADEVTLGRALEARRVL